MKKKISITVIVLLCIVALIIFLCVKNASRNDKQSQENSNFKIVTSFYPIYIMTLNVTEGANNIELKKDSEEYLVIFSGVIGGQDNYDVNFTIKFYDTANNLVASETLDLSSYDSFGRPSMGFVATARLDNQETFNSITKYSISLSK